MSKNSRYVRLSLDNAVHYDDCVGEVEVFSNLAIFFSINACNFSVASK